MKLRIASVLFGIVFVNMVFISQAVATGPTFQGLGDLPGGNFHSFAYDVSADGSTVVGNSSSASGDEAFRWTAASGMVGLGDLPGGSFSSTALGISADGSTIVGYSDSASGHEAFRWTSASGMIGLGHLPSGRFWSSASDVSADGSAVVGLGRLRFGLRSVPLDISFRNGWLGRFTRRRFLQLGHWRLSRRFDHRGR